MAGQVGHFEVGGKVGNDLRVGPDVRDGVVFAEDADDLHLIGQADRSGDTADGDVDVTADEVVAGAGAAAVGDDIGVDAGGLNEDLRGDVGGRKSLRRGDGDGAGRGARISESFATMGLRVLFRLWSY